MCGEPFEYDHRVDWLSVASFTHTRRRVAVAWPDTLSVMTKPVATEWADTQPAPMPTLPIDADVWTPAGAWYDSRLALGLFILLSAVGSAFHYLPI